MLREIAPQQDVRFQLLRPSGMKHAPRRMILKRIQEKAFLFYISTETKIKKSTLVAQKLSAVGASVSAINVGHNVHLEAPMLYLREMQNFLVGIDQTLWD